jgi:hypothetical protein
MEEFFRSTVCIEGMLMVLYLLAHMKRYCLAQRELRCLRSGSVFKALLSAPGRCFKFDIYFLHLKRISAFGTEISAPGGVLRFRYLLASSRRCCLHQEDA